MIDWGAKPNPSRESYQSLGAIATGDRHVFVRYRTGADGASLHPLQRTGQVSATSHSLMGGRMTAAGGRSIGGAQSAPAAPYNRRLPPIVPIGAGSSRDPLMRV